MSSTLRDKLAQVFKADAATTDLSSGGLLLDDQANRWLHQPLKDSVMLSECRTEPMGSHTKDLPKMITPTSVAKPGVEGVAMPVADRSKVTFDEVVLQTNEIIAEARFPWGYLEDSMSQEQLKQIVMTRLGLAFRNNVEQLAINGDTGSTDALLALQDGWLARFTSNVVAAGSVAPTKGTFSTAIREMDEEWINDPEAMRHYIGPHAKLRYQELIADRMTNLGDGYFTGTATVTGAGVPIVGVPLFPNEDGVGSNETTCLTTRPDNMIIGYWKERRIHMATDVPARKDIVLLRTRVGVNIEWNDGATKTTGLLGKN